MRRSVSEALGVIMEVVGQPAMAKLMPDLSSSKLSAIKSLSSTTPTTAATPAAPKAIVVSKPRQASKFSGRTVIQKVAVKPPSDDKKSEVATKPKPVALASAKPPSTVGAGSALARKLRAPPAVVVRSRQGKN